MSKIVLPIDTKSLYLNILNDNLIGHTATVATPLKQGNAYNKDLGRILEIKDKEIFFQDKPALINEMLKNSKSKIVIKNVFVFDKISVNGIEIKTEKQYCIFIKEEVDPNKAQFGRLKIHYPTSLKYDDVDLSINNKEIINLISKTLNDYAFIVKSFEYDTTTKILNFNALIVGENKVPYSKVFINEKGVGSKFNKIFNETADDYDMEIISLRQYCGQCISTENFYDCMQNNKNKALNLVEQRLKKQGCKNVQKIINEYPYCLYDISYEENGILKYALIYYTATNLEYFNMTRARLMFCNDFTIKTKIFLITNILNNPNLLEINIEDLDSFNKSINSIKYVRGEDK